MLIGSIGIALAAAVVVAAVQKAASPCRVPVRRADLRRASQAERRRRAMRRAAWHD